MKCKSIWCFDRPTVILGVVKIRKVSKYWIPSANARHGARQKKLRKTTSIQKLFENEIKKSREFQSNLSTFSACNFQLEIFDYHYPNNHNSKKKAFSCCLENLSYYHEFLCFFYNSRCKQYLKLSSFSWLYMLARSAAYPRAWN